MSMAAPRPFAGPNYAASSSPTTASSLNYSQYGSNSFGPGSGAGGSIPPSRQLSNSSSGYGPSARVGNGGGGGNIGPPPRGMTGGSSASGGGLRPPNGSDRKVESREVARMHWRALREFLASWLKEESPSSRASAREKLTRLTKLQFQELSTDVYDELMRRMAVDNGNPDGNVPFLPVREDFHPKRNQARQKLATLPKNRFKDLASDVFYELRRRYPEFEEEDAHNQIRYDEPPPAPGPRPAYSQSQSQQSLRDPRIRENPTPPPSRPDLNRLVSSSSSQHQRQGSRGMSQSSHKSRPSRDRDEEILSDNGRAPSRSQANPMAATNEVVVPNKSRLREEDIEVPYARDSQIMDVRQSRASSRGESRSSMGGGGGRDSRASFSRAGSVVAEDDALQAQNRGDRERSRTVTARPEPSEVASPGLTDDREYYDRMSFTSNVTNKSKQAQQAQVDEEREQKLRAEYEFRIAGLDRKVVSAERERDEARRSEAQEKERRLEWEDEVRGLKERAATHASALRSLQHELDLAKDATEAAKGRVDQSSRAAEEEIAQWRDRYDGLEDEYRRLEEEKIALEANQGGSGGGSDSQQAAAELRSELHSLVDELNSLSMRNDELMTQREQDAMRMNEMEAKVEEYKRKYDAVRIELRNLKATSTMFVPKPVTDDHLPASADGNIADVNVSAFQSAIDGLLTAARSSAPSGVLPAMKAIVEAITEIGEDVKTFESRPNIDVDVSRLESLKHESTTRLNNLMQAARNHAMASGLSPVSLLDAAAGHLSANVVEIIKLLKIRRSGNRNGPGQDLLGGRRRSSLSIKDMVNRERDRNEEVRSANGNWDREYGNEERLNESQNSNGPPVMVSRPSNDQLSSIGNRAPSRTATPTESSRLNGSYFGNTTTASSQPMSAQNSMNSNNGGRPNLRINSFQSTSSMGRSDSFDLERKQSMLSDRGGDSAGGLGRSLVEPRSGNGGGGRSPYERGGDERESMNSTGSSSGGPLTAPDPYAGGGGHPVQIGREEDEEEEREDEVDDGREWDDLKPYLNAQSAALVNSIQNLLAAIRTNSSPSALNEHLSEVIAIASSIVAVSTNALPNSLRGEGDSLLRDLVSNTNKLSEAQEQGKNTGNGGGFEKGLRQQIASASFGVAKSLKSLMKLGGAE
ncbi:hypothetical protein CI109_106940 [Kwoniella shandongensis]|uniref:Uncharacterized protein n=1 Tax=Kwoniella shandongensis TaxID=1734106 RepID=A0A5M6C675_9TREE|nr:uncharacterized protein CI109_000806 [Kwoniella shandongensis]KAA5530626.1 hypothetical protein CI109_000806 [Kwoniella shandongensis]